MIYAAAFNGSEMRNVHQKVLSISGAGTRLIWYPRMAAFRAGQVTGDQWNDDNIGLHSVAMGYNTEANSLFSTAIGGNTTASGHYSTAMGSSTNASGPFSTAMGFSTNPSGDYSTSMGYDTEASGNSSDNKNTSFSPNYFNLHS